MTDFLNKIDIDDEEFEEFEEETEEISEDGADLEEFTIDFEGFAKWYSHQKTNRGRFPSEESVKGHTERIRSFARIVGEPIVSQKNLRIAYENCLETLQPTTVNNVVNALNLYVRYIGKPQWKLSPVKIQQQQFLDDIISMADYEFVLKKAKSMKKYRIWLYCKIAGTTGMRLAEMLQIKREHIAHGCVDIYGKGAKRRRIYFPEAMQQEVLEVLDELDITSGKIFPQQKRTIQSGLQRFAVECELPKGLLHPHGLRHFFAKEFIRKYQNIALLADLLGHSNLETTRIYLKYTSREQAEIVNEVVTW